MPAGVPVACMAIGGAKNAALMALQILGINNNRVFKKLAVYRKKLAESVRKKNRR
jgi:5-(carboxyamino)imidazole ribonucleotide mutase